MEGQSLLKSKPAKPTRRLVVLILDGWGYNPETKGNLIARANTPVMDRLRSLYPFASLAAAGESVGLPSGTVGNSEAGHLHIGAGRRVYSDRLKIDRAIESGEFFSNKAFRNAMAEARKRGTALHLMGIVSFFSSHGMMNHLIALMDMAKKEGVGEMYIHAMLGRRGEMPESGANYVKQIEDKCGEMKLGRVVSVIGRYWSMDREENWDRIEKDLPDARLRGRIPRERKGARVSGTGYRVIMGGKIVYGSADRQVDTDRSSRGISPGKKPMPS